jgi:UDP-N-acetylmuramate--alanine ligase
MNEAIQDWQTIKHIHFVGIKGVAMAALAVWAKEAGFVVTGSDTEEGFPTDSVLQKAGIRPLVGFLPEHIKHVDLVIYTGAHAGKENPEVVAALSNTIRALPHGKALGQVMLGKKQISVAGCHGKTTTTAMIATILIHAHKDPSYAIGCGEIGGLGLPGHYGSSDTFVAEADEYVTDPKHDLTPRFLWQLPNILVITNIDFDHPDVYPDLVAVTSAYKQLASQIQKDGILITCLDDKNSEPIRKLGTNRTISYGFSKESDVVIESTKISSEGNQFFLQHGNTRLGPFTLHVPGMQNLSNATAAILVCQQIGVSIEKIADGLSQFRGAKRRFEIVGTKNGATIIDDYAHHPNEIQATLKAVREWYADRKVIAVFQPHTVSRTRSLIHEFSQAFSLADVVYISDIYASAREAPDPAFTSEVFVREIQKQHKNVIFCPTYEKIASELKNNADEGDIILFLGAGSVGGWGKLFVESS